MYTKRKKVVESAIDKNLLFLCEEFLKYNDDTSFVISKKFIEKNGIINDEIPSAKVIVSSTPIEKLIIPSSYVLLKEDYVTDFYDNSVRVKLIFSDLEVSNELPNGNKTLKFSDEDKIKKALTIRK